MGWVDSHAHVTFVDGGADRALVDARAAGIDWIVCVGVDLESSQRSLALADRHPDVWATVGLHPHDASRLAAEWGALEPLAGAERAVAVGETGLDFHYRHSPQDEQEIAFRWHIRLAHRLERALVVHTREAWDETFRVLEEEGVPPRTVVHCFTGGPREAERALALGTYLSFSGIVSFKNAADVRAAAACTPLDRLLVETDAPFLAPEPHRGRPNAPALLPVVGEALAAAAGRPFAEVMAATAQNACRVFRPDAPGPTPGDHRSSAG